ncbi:single-stranded DNA-binding protein [Sulfuricella sp. T08]|uniref:hypothetical protein n=1 Tax=Sulfuricella sp. T08 TaxID=1632857 RepID=UPI000617982B|nr:hypothetical protein [Sulfuricella sp. T08]GAO35792.1 single-stranded DNA-binding protein [Sulfuricella sp. T08]
MAEPQSIQTPAAKPALTFKPLQMLVSGKVESKRKFNNRHYSVLICPSGDEMVGPAIIEVESGSALADVGDMWRGICAARGSRHSYKMVDKETGEQVTIKTARHFVVAVD